MVNRSSRKSIVALAVAALMGTGFVFNASDAKAFDLAEKIEYFLNGGGSSGSSDIGPLDEFSAPESESSPSNSEYPSVKDTSILDNHWRNMNQIEVADPGSQSDYDRDLFDHWELIGTEQTKNDWPDNIPRSCDARRAALIRDGHNLEVETRGCKIHVKDSGGWKDPYGTVEDDGSVFYLKDVKPVKFDIDHIVALGDAWRSGASKWDEDKRQAFANDPLNLSISSASANRTKSDSSPSDYMPPGDFLCEYAKRYAAVKAKYDLATTQADIDVLTKTGKSCGF